MAGVSMVTNAPDGAAFVATAINMSTSSHNHWWAKIPIRDFQRIHARARRRSHPIPYRVVSRHAADMGWRLAGRQIIPASEHGEVLDRHAIDGRLRKLRQSIEKWVGSIAEITDTGDTRRRRDTSM